MMLVKVGKEIAIEGRNQKKKKKKKKNRVKYRSWFFSPFLGAVTFHLVPFRSTTNQILFIKTSMTKKKKKKKKRVK
jgi:hypothetical protein